MIGGDNCSSPQSVGIFDVRLTGGLEYQMTFVQDSWLELSLFPYHASSLKTRCSLSDGQMSDAEDADNRFLWGSRYGCTSTVEAVCCNARAACYTYDKCSPVGSLSS